MMSREKFKDLCKKPLLTVEEAARYSGIGEHTIRTMIADPACDFTLCVGSKTMIKRKYFKKYILNVDRIF